MNLTDDDRAMMRHALGIEPDYGHPGHRNNYAAMPESDAGRRWAEFVDAGLAVLARAPGALGPLAIYMVTDAGREALGPEGQIGAEG